MSSVYKQILVAIDGSKEAEGAFKKSIGIAERNNATLNLVNVIDTRSFGAIEGYDRSIAHQVYKSAEELLSEYKKEAANAGIENVNIVVDYGSPKVMIPRNIAQKVHADLIVCGATGLNAVERFVMGSVSERIVRSAKCDVLVVRTDQVQDDASSDFHASGEAKSHTE